MSSRSLPSVRSTPLTSGAHVVKLDVEGSEGDVLRGAQNLHATHGPTLIVELHDTAAEVCELLDAGGYVAERLDGPGPPRNAPAHAHLIARPG